jgi:hypothetical protein
MVLELSLKLSIVAIADVDTVLDKAYGIPNVMRRIFNIPDTIKAK